MGVVEGVAVGTGGCVAAEAMLIEVLNNSRVRQRVITLERQQIVASARQDPLGDRGLAAHRVQRHDAVLQGELVQQDRNSGDLVGLAIDATLVQHRPCSLAQALTRCRGDCSRPWSNERRSVLPSMATTSRSKPAASEPVQAVKPASNVSGSISMNTLRKVSCEGIPLGSSRKVLSQASLLRP